jgi:hypothetical protein
MVTIVKHEWHQVDSIFEYELTEDILPEIFPDADEDELAEIWESIQNGEADIEDIMDAASAEGVDIDWDRTYDDWYTDRKGGYEVTYEYGE